MDWIGITAAIVAATAMIGAIGGLVKIYFDLKAVHVIVNSQKTAMQKEINELRDLVTKSVDKGTSVVASEAAKVESAAKKTP